MKNHAGRRARVAALLLSAVAAAPAAAQEVQRGTIENPNEVLARPRPGYDPVGFKLGGFTAVPYATADLSYDDNIFASDARKVSDESILATGGVDVTSDWATNRLALHAAGGTEQFARHGSQSVETADVRLGGTADVRRDVAIDFDGRYARLTEPRGSLGDVFLGGTPSQYDLKEFKAAARWSPGAFKLQANGAYDDFDYRYIRFGGVRYDQGYRNYHSPSFGGRVDYAFSPMLGGFVSADRSFVRYDRRGDDGLEFNSTGTRVLGGVNVALSRLVVGSFGVGWIHQGFRDPRFKDFSGFAYSGKIVWNPTTLLSLTFATDTTVGQSGIVGVGGVLERQESVQADYELVRNVVLHAQARHFSYDYKGLSRTDRYLGGEIGGRYLLTRALSLGATYSHADQNSQGDFARRFADNRLTVALRLQH